MMMNNLYIPKLLLFLFLFSLFGCGAPDNSRIQNPSSPQPPTEVGGPKDALASYWEAAMKKEGESDKFLTIIPTEYLLCSGKATSECREVKTRLLAEKDSDSSNLGEIRKDREPTEKLVKNIPYGIRTGFWMKYSVLGNWEIENEARLRILIDSKPTKLVQDVLLYKLDGNWKIFGFVSEGENEDTFANKDAMPGAPNSDVPAAPS